jgi:hypothetical protein
LEDPDWVETIDNINQVLKDPFSDRVGYLLYKIIDEESKRLFVEANVKAFMPWSPLNE